MEKFNNWNPRHPSPGVLSDLAARYAPTQEPPGSLPPDFDETLFNADQLEYLTDFYLDARRACLQRLFDLLTSSADNRTASPRIAGINIFILGKLAGLSDFLLELDWAQLHLALHTTRSDIFAQKKHMLRALRMIRTPNKHHPK